MEENCEWLIIKIPFVFRTSKICRRVKFINNLITITEYWEIWRREYVLALRQQQRYKKQAGAKTSSINDVVLIYQEKLNTVVHAKGAIEGLAVTKGIVVSSEANFSYVYLHSAVFYAHPGVRHQYSVVPSLQRGITLRKYQIVWLRKSIKKTRLGYDVRTDSRVLVKQVGLVNNTFIVDNTLTYTFVVLGVYSMLVTTSQSLIRVLWMM